MPTQKIDPKVIFASDAPAIDKPPVFSDKTKGWDVSRANDGRPEIKQMNKMQQDTDLKILWLNENAVLPYDASIDYPDGAVALKDGSFKQLSSGSWVEFLDDFADKDAVKRGIANRYDPSLTYNSGERVVLTNGDIVKSTIDGNANDPNVDMTGWVYSSLTPSNNLSDVADEAEARTNLDVYSQAEVDTAIANATPTIPDATETTSGKAKIATTAIAQAGTNDTDIITSKKLRDALNAEGEAPIFACRAWVSFDSTTAGVVIRASANIQSIVRSSEGKFVITFIDEMPHSDYIVLTGTRADSNIDNSTLSLVVNEAFNVSTQNAKTTKTLSVALASATGAYDSYGMSLGVVC